jgi:hypothetical protein
MNRFATLVTTFATFATTVIILLTLFEMANQRKSAYKPDLVFGTQNSFSIDINKSTNTPEIMPFIEPRESHSKRVFHLRQPTLNLYNIGMATAKAITVNWKFDTDAYINIIRGLDTEKKYTINMTYLGKSPFLRVTQPGETADFSMTSFVDSIDYILPAHVQKEPHVIMLPPPYLPLISIIFALSCKEVPESNPPTPKLKVILNYLDIGNNHHKKEFSVETGLGIISYRKNVLENFGIIIEVKEANRTKRVERAETFIHSINERFEKTKE